MQGGGENGWGLKVWWFSGKRTLYTPNSRHMPTQSICLQLKTTTPKKKRVELISVGLKTGASNDKTLAQAAVKRTAVQAFSRKERESFFPITDLKHFFRLPWSILREKVFLWSKFSADNSFFTSGLLLEFPGSLVKRIGIVWKGIRAHRLL